MNRRWLSGLGLALAVSAVMAQPDDVDALSSRLSAPLTSGLFVQEKHLTSLPVPLISQGHFALETGHLLWQTDTPFASRLEISDAGVSQWEAGQLVWQVSAADQPLVATLGQLLIALLAGDSHAMAELFSIQSIALQGDACWQANLMVRDRVLAAYVGEVNIQGCTAVEQLQLIELNGDTTLIKLSAAL